jgi:hypothetical protein
MKVPEVSNDIRRDLAHAARALAQARAFTFIYVVSLGIGLALVPWSRHS